MGIRIDGNADVINAADGTLTVEGISVNITGISTASGGYKVGSAYTVFSNGNVATAGIITATKGNFSDGEATISGSTATLHLIDVSDNPNYRVQNNDGTFRIYDATNDTSRLNIDSSGNISVGTAATIKANGNATFSGIVTAASFVGDGSGLTGAGPSLTGSTNNTIVTVTGANAIAGEANLTFDGSTLAVTGDETVSGRLLINHTSARSIAGGNSLIQVEAADSTGRISIVQNRTEASGAPFLSLGKSRGGSVGSSTVVQSGDTVGTVAFAGADGTDFPSVAQIVGQVDGTPGNNDMPGRLVVRTCPDGSDSTVERLRITSAGDILIGNTLGGAEAINMVGDGGGILISRSESGSPSDGQTLADIGLNSYASSQTCSSADVLIRGQADGAHSGSSAGSALLLFTKPAATGPGSSPTERFRIDKDGNVGINQANPTDKLHVVGTTNLSGNSYLTNAYVSGNIYLGGTGSSNQLSDYETGTYTAHFAVEGQGNMSMSGRVGKYVKVGSIVTVIGGGVVSSISGQSSSNAIEFSNLPFPEGNGGAASCGLPFPVKLTSMSNSGIGNMNGNEPYQFIGRLDNDATNGRIEAIRNGSNQDPQNASLALDTNTQIFYMFSYITDA